MKKVVNIVCCKTSCDEMKSMLRECCLPTLHEKNKKKKLCKVREGNTIKNLYFIFLFKNFCGDSSSFCGPKNHLFRILDDSAHKF